MKKNKYLHFAPDSVYTQDYIHKINKLYHEKEHCFFVYSYDFGKKRAYQDNNIFIVQNNSLKNLFKIIRFVFQSRTIILHGLFLDKVNFLMFAVLTRLSKKCYVWVIWGGDLTIDYEKEQQIRGLSIQKRIKRFCRRTIIKNLDVVVSCESDYDYAYDAYKIKCSRLEAMYAYNFPDINSRCVNKEEGRLNVLIGHSASVIDKHIEAYHILKRNDFEGDVFSVLSYDGDQKYIQEVCEEGERLFGKKYHPITEWMNREDYMKFLSSMDMAIFLGDKQTAAGNILMMLMLGIKIFANDYGIVPILKKMGAIIMETCEINKKSIVSGLSPDKIEVNKSIALKIVSDEYFKDHWDNVFLFKKKKDINIRI